MLGNIVKLFEWPLVRKQLYKYSPFTILPVAIKGARNEKDYLVFHTPLTVVWHRTCILFCPETSPALLTLRLPSFCQWA